MKWTKMQEKAVFHPLSDILVTAAAGSGKTQVLTGRILDRIKSKKTDISKMLVITFTNAAAAEMKKRIASKIEEEVKKDPKNNHLRRQLSLVAGADISTIHSFCLKVLRSYFYLIDIDPAFKIAETYDTVIMKEEALADAFDYFYEAEDENFLNLVSLVSGSKSDSAVALMVSEIIKFAESTPFPQKWLDSSKKAFKFVSEETSPFITFLKNKAMWYITDACLLLHEGLELARVAGLSKYKEVLEGEFTYFNSFPREILKWDEIYNLLRYKFVTAPRIGKNDSVVAKDEVKSKRDKAKELIEEAKKCIAMPLCDALSATNKMKEPTLALISLAEKAMELYAQKKNDKNVLDFNDLEHFTIKILTKEDNVGNIIPSDAALEIRDEYTEIYVDEYQDTNDTQELILNMISGKSKGLPNIFMVGDMKQSIYGFRHTDPEAIFGKKSDTYKNVLEATEDDKYVKIPLSQNFRSREEILSAINMVFDTLMSKRIGGIEYVDDERLAPGSTVYTEPITQKPITLNMLTYNKITAAEGLTMNAEFTAEKIEKLIESKMRIYDKELDAFRPISYKDIVILLRAPSGRTEFFEAALSKRNIPVYVEKPSQFFESIETSVLISYLRIIDNPLQDIPFVSVLRSPIFSFDENDLSTLALMGKSNLYHAIKEASTSCEPISKKCYRFIKMLTRYRKKASLMGVYDFITYLINDLHYTSYVSAMYDSESHLNNLNQLLTLAKKSDEGSYRGLYSFLSYIDMLYSTSGLVDEAHSISLDAVRVMSIHKSKGLEFPYVFLCCAEGDIYSKKLNTNDILVHKDLGIGINAFSKHRYKFQSPFNQAIQEIKKDESISEELRVLYVALTRAREYIDVVAYRKLKKGEEYFSPPTTALITPSDVISAKNYMEWLLISRKSGEKIALNVFENYSPETEDKIIEEDDFTPPSPLPCPKEYADILSYTYPDTNLMSVKSKYSVTELKESESDVKELSGVTHNAISLRKPAFLNTDKVFTSAEKGSIMHYVMQKLDFKNSDFTSQIDKMNLTDEEKAVVDLDKIALFYKTDIAKRLADAKVVEKEAPFTFKKRLSDITKNESDDALVLIQGIIDCYFIENDKIVLIDYKTDKNATEKIIKERYSTQISLYEEALSKKYALPVSEKYIYLFDKNEFVKF